MIRTTIELEVDIEVIGYEPGQRGSLECEPLAPSVEIRVMVGDIDVTHGLTDEQYALAHEAALRAYDETAWEETDRGRDYCDRLERGEDY